MTKEDLIIEKIENVAETVSKIEVNIQKISDKIEKEHDINIKQDVCIDIVVKDLKGLGEKVDTHITDHKKSDKEQEREKVKNAIIWGVCVFLFTVIGGGIVTFILRKILGA